MDEDGTLSAVMQFATKAHGSQKRKYTPEPYIVHPVRVMELCRNFTDDICILSAALLHDVLEDTAVTTAEMSEFLKTVMSESDAGRTLSLVTDLTDVYIKKDYPQYNRRKRKELERQRISLTSADSQTIKYADIIDNCREIVKHDSDFARVFLSECRTVLKIMHGGNSVLREQARTMVEDGLKALRITR